MGISKQKHNQKEGNKKMNESFELFNVLQKALKQDGCDRLNRSAFAEQALIELGYDKDQASLVVGLNDLPLIKNTQYILGIIGDLS